LIEKLRQPARLSARSCLRRRCADRGVDLGNPSADIVALRRIWVEVLARITESDGIRGNPAKPVESRSGRPGGNRIDVLALRGFDPAGDQNCLEIRKGSSLRAQRSNLVDNAPTWLEIAASPCGLLAMTRFHLIPRDAETGHYRASAALIHAP
jgi:hypothetical protein